MRSLKNMAAVAALSCMLIEPALAAEDYRPPEMGQQRTLSAYAGGTVRLAMSSHRHAAPKAALTLGFMQKNGSANTTSPVSRRVVEMVSFGGAPHSKPQLMIAGVPTQEFDRKLGMSTLGAVAIGGLLAVGAIVAVAASSGTNIPDDIVTGL